jgi:hypothetical protein
MRVITYSAAHAIALRATDNQVAGADRIVAEVRR